MPNVWVPIDDRAALVLPGAGDDFASAGATAIDQHDHRIVVEIMLLVREEFLLLALLAALRIDDEAAVEEVVRDRNRLIQETARIVAEIEYEALDVAVVFLIEFRERLSPNPR